MCLAFKIVHNLKLKFKMTLITNKTYLRNKCV